MELETRTNEKKGKLSAAERDQTLPVERHFYLEIGQGEGNHVIIENLPGSKSTLSSSEEPVQKLTTEPLWNPKSLNQLNLSTRKRNGSKTKTTTIKRRKDIGLPVILSTQSKPEVKSKAVIVKKDCLADEVNEEHGDSNDPEADEIAYDCADTPAQMLECSECEWNTSNHFKYHRHLLEHSNGKNVKCTHCCNTIAMFIERQETDVEETKDKTQSVSSDQNSEEKAEDQTRSKAKLFCFICLEGFDNLRHLKRHLSKKHPDELDQNVNLRIFVRESNRATINIKGEKLICSFCGWKSERHFNYHRHVLRHCFSTQNYICPYCCKHIAPDNSTSSYGVSQLTCADCSQVFYSRCHLSTHAYQVHGATQTGNLSCYICNYHCTSRKHLEKHHEIAHQGQEFMLNEETLQALESAPQPLLDADGNELKEYACTECGFKCIRQDTLKKHMITHVPENSRKVWCCSEPNCWFESYSRISLNVHVSGKHKRQKRASKLSEMTVIFSCDLCCDFNTPSEEQLFIHQDSTSCLVKDGEKEVGQEAPAKKPRAKKTRAPSGCCIKYSCNHCQFVATRRWNMVRHKETAHGNTELYSCEFCHFQTKHRKFLINHYTKVHLLDFPRGVTSSQKAAGVTDLRGVFTVCPAQPLVAVEQNVDQLVRYCTVCSQALPASQMNKHLLIAHREVKLFHCYALDCDYVTTSAALLTSHVTTKHETNHCDLVTTSEKTSGYMCSRRCGYVTESVEALHSHDTFNCNLRTEPVGGASNSSTQRLGIGPRDANYTQEDDEALANAMKSISEITEAMKASGIEKPVIQQHGKTIFITIDREDILKKQLKENLLKLNTMTSATDSPSPHIQYILNANNEITIYDSVDLLQSSVQSSITLEHGDEREIQDVVAPAVEQYTEWINMPPKGVRSDAVKECTVVTQGEGVSPAVVVDNVEQCSVYTSVAATAGVSNGSSSAVLEGSEFLKTQSLSAAGVNNGQSLYNHAHDVMAETFADNLQSREETVVSEPVMNEGVVSELTAVEGSSWTVCSTDESGQTLLYKIEGDIGLSDNGELTTEMQQILAKALEKVDDTYNPELK